MPLYTANHARIARALRRDIGCHYKLIGQQVPQEVYLAEQAKSDAAVALARYLIDHLDTNPTLFARALGMPGYFRQM